MNGRAAANFSLERLVDVREVVVTGVAVECLDGAVKLRTRVERLESGIERDGVVRAGD
jgi:hypothetical protein